MGKTEDEIITEETVPGADSMDMGWMASFWEAFTECVVQMDAQYVVTNIRCRAECDFLMAELIGKWFPDFAIEKDKPLVLNELDQLKAGAQYARFQCQSKAGSYYRWTLVAFHDKGGAFSGYRGVAVDVTEQTLKEITLNWQRAIMEGGRDFVSIADMEGKELYTNPGAYKMTGYDPASGALPPELIFTPEHLEAVRGEGLESVIANGVWTGWGNLVQKDGTLIPIEHSMFSVRNDLDETILIATIIRDITVFQEHERTLEEARKAAELANNAKSEFLSRMSHEIRTPMNAIIGMINIGLNTGDIDRKNYCFTRADNASKHLLGIINDILDMSKIEADRFELSYSVFDFEKALRDITSMVNVSAVEKQQNLVIDLSYDVPSYILSDELRLSQVITNLLTNAIKFTPEKGTIILSIHKTEEIDDEVSLLFEVSDTGIGISKEQQIRLFTPFNQADSDIALNFGGLGLGLAISKRIVELMDGEMWVESELGKGARFFFILKTKKVEGGYRAELYKKINLGKVRILAVDDSEETRDYFKHVMGAFNLQCDVARDGPQALHMVKNHSGKPYNIFFVDWKLPGMDGIELTRRIKEINGENSNVIMISASDWSSIESEAVTAGVDHFIAKPLFPSTLIDTINICMGAEAYEPINGIEQESPVRLFDFSEHTILIAEDVEINREIMSAILTESEVSIEYAENGKEAVSLFNANPDKYDLILMDINMPEMDGYEATRSIRALNHSRAKEIPIVAMTANVFKEDIERCLASGMNDHTGKPIDSDDLFRHLDKYLKNSVSI